MLTGTARAAKVSSIEQNKAEISGLGASPLGVDPSQRELEPKLEPLVDAPPRTIVAVCHVKTWVVPTLAPPVPTRARVPPARIRRSGPAEQPWECTSPQAWSPCSGRTRLPSSLS